MTVSEAAKKEIEEYIGVKSSLIDVISEAPNQLFQPLPQTKAGEELRRRLKLPEKGRLIVYVGGLAPHKNLVGFLQGFSLARARGDIEDVHVVLVGDYEGAGFHSNTASLRQLASSDALNNYVHFTGFISDEDLVVLYNEAIAAAMPSFSEGFGLPAVEAMACGTPVLSSDQGSLPEVVGEAGIYFNPYDTESIGDAISRLSSDEPNRLALSEMAHSRAAGFTWERAAKLALGHLEALLPSAGDCGREPG